MITSAELAHCYRRVDEQTGLPYYEVTSEKTPGQTYEVRAVRVRKDGVWTWVFTCTCKAGQHGFVNCKDEYCKHVRWAREAATLYKQASAEKERVATDIDAETLARVWRRDQERIEREKTAKPSRRVAYCQTRPQGFSLLKR